MVLYGLIGYPLGHSWSPGYFRDLFLEKGLTDHVYQLFPISGIELFNDLVSKQPELSGLNVTIPYKTSILPFLDALSPEAAEVGAVNCIHFKRKSGKPFLTGFNTDVFGFENSIKPYLNSGHSNALILGNGGASKAVQFVLKKLGIQFKLVSRNYRSDSHLVYQELNNELILSHKLIINTTPLGMHPNDDCCPVIPYDAITSQHLLFDLIYNPPVTKFMAAGLKNGATVVNGKRMLEMQADESFQIWKNE